MLKNTENGVLILLIWIFIPEICGVILKYLRVCTVIKLYFVFSVWENEQIRKNFYQAILMQTKNVSWFEFAISHYL